MTEKISFKSRLFSALFAVFFAISSLFILTSKAESVYAIPETTEETNAESQTTEKKPETTEEASAKTEEDHDTCAEQTGAMHWIVCPLTKTIANAVDSMYSLFDGILTIKPFSSDQNSPIRLIWNYVRNITNIIFIIILLIVVYSQLTGLGINNFGVKRILPRLIIAAVLVNLSWIICSLAIDLSNIIGISLRGVFTHIKDTALAAGTVKSQVNIDWASLLGGIVAGGTIAGVTIAYVGGLGALFWMLAPILLGALVSVIAGVITVAARQAIVALLLMISPLAFVAYLIPNTEKWFEKWKKTLFQMLIFFPAFSFLFGASELIGWTIITSATNGLGLILGMAVQVFPLFFAFSLMKMSGTALGAINNTIRKMSSPIQRSTGKYSDSQRELRRQKYLASKPRNFQLSKRLAQKVNDDNVRRAEDTKTYAETVTARGKAKAANYKTRRGTVSRRGEEFYEMQARRMEYQRVIARTANDFESGLGAYGVPGTKQAKRLNALDQTTISASDRLKYEQERTTKINQDNAIGYFERTHRAAMSHIDPNSVVEGETIKAIDHERYKDMLSTMHGNHSDALYIDAGAAYAYGAQNRIVSSKFTELFNSAVPTQQLVDILQGLTTTKDANKYIDSIVSGFRALNMRGDTDITSERVSEITRDLAANLYAEGGIKLGTHASQTLASFCMFDVKDNDPVLRRFGKFINLETAHAFNRKNDPNYEPRRNLNVTMNEYITGQYHEVDANGNPMYNDDGTPYMRPVNKDMVTLLKGTSYGHIERTAFDNQIQTIRNAYTDASGAVNIEGFETKLKEVNESILPNIIGDALTYASGSEQIMSFAQYLTGMKLGKNGSWQKLWENAGNKGFYGLPMEYFIDFTETYIRSQVPNQIANFKSDVFENVRALFRTQSATEYQAATGISYNDKFVEYLTEDGYSAVDLETLENGDDKEQKRAKIIKAKASSKTNQFYDNLTEEEDGTVGAIQHFRNSLGKDVFVRLQNSARSGALNNAKGPVVEWLGIKFSGKKKQEDNQQNPSEQSPLQTPELDASVHQNLTGTFMSLYTSSTDDPHSYYSQAMQSLTSQNLNNIAQDFTEYYNNNATITTEDLHNYLLNLLDEA